MVVQLLQHLEQICLDAGRILAYGGVNIEANTDITFTTGTWTGEKAHKIQAHGNHNYYQTTDSHYFRTYNSGSGDDKAVIDC